MEAHLRSELAREKPGMPNGHSTRLLAARQVLGGEAKAIEQLAERLDESFTSAVEAVLQCQGQIVVSGMGKAGLIGQKISATLASTGTRSIFLHPAEAVHGDLGRVDPSDLLLLLSYSGETEELNRLLDCPRLKACVVMAMTSTRLSSLGSTADIVLPLGNLREVCPLGLAPSTSTTAMLALGDALALVVSQERGLTREGFAGNHPAGNLGRLLARVDQVMRPLDNCRLAQADTSVCDVFVGVSRPGRRSGAVMLVDDLQRLVGIFTDSDLARLLEQRRHSQLDAPIAEVMTTKFRTVASGAAIADAIELLVEHKISELPVIDAEGRPLGLIDITDVVGLVTQAEQQRAHQSPTASAAVESCRVAADGQLISISITSGR